MTISSPLPSQTEALRALWKEAFGDGDAFLDLFFQQAFSSCRCLCAMEGEAVSGMVHWLDCTMAGETYAYLYAVAVRQDRRGRGICSRLLTAARERLALDGYAGALLYPQDGGLREMYRRAGYADATRYCESVFSAGEPPAELHAITAREYFSLRRQRLGPGSVLQEGAFLPLLEAELRFYRGRDFLLAARQEQQYLHGVELLGNVLAAPGILAALGVPFGAFRTPGPGLPGAMFLPLKEDAKAPKYLGFLLE